LSSQTFEGHSCCNKKNPDYTITYKVDDNTTSDNQICKECITSKIIFDDKLGKLVILQLKILKIICNHCNQNVTKSKGCIACNTVFGNLVKKESAITNDD